MTISSSSPPATRTSSRPERRAAGWRGNSAVDALETGRSFDGEDSLIPVLMNYSDLPVDYMDDPIVVLDQPERLRDRCENRYMEFGEQFAAALERGEALPVQAELLWKYEAVLARLDGRSRSHRESVSAHGA